VLDRLIESVSAGESRALVLRGEPGVGKTALLDYAAWRAADCRVVRAAGVQSEMELAFAGLHQVCAPMLDRLERLPVPQREALETAFGFSRGSVPDRFLLGLAVLGLLSEVAGERPLVCLVDDVQWLDHASAQALAFVARRLAAEGVGLIFAAREPNADLAGLAELVVEGLPVDEARKLLDSVLTGPLDERVREQILAETRGNPLALVELVRGLMPAELAGGFGLPGSVSLSGRIEESFGRRVAALPAQSQRLVLLAAADPVGDPLLVWRAAGRVGISVRRRPPAEVGLVSSGARRCSGIRWCGRRSTGRRRFRSGSRCTVPWPRPPTRSPIPTAVPGTGHRPRPDRMRTSPGNSSGRPAGRKPAGVWPQRPRSSSARRR
jgi:hypothetical protein